MQWMTHIVRKTTNKLNRNDNTTYQTREHWKLLNSNENTNQSCTRPSGSCRIGLNFHSRSTISNTHSFGMRYYTILVGALVTELDPAKVGEPYFRVLNFDGPVLPER